MLITTMSRRPVAIPLSNIVRAQAVEGGWIVTDSQGEDHKVNDVSWDVAVEGTPTAMIPALPGTYLINANSAYPDGPLFWRENVLGWMICADTQVRPVVLNPEGLLSPPWVVLHPDGRVERSDGSSWESSEEWLSEEERLRGRGTSSSGTEASQGETYG